MPLPPSDLAREMAVDRRAREAFFGRIDAMQRDGQLLVNRKGELCVTAKLDLISGTVQGHPDGFGFLVPDDGGADLFLSPAEMHKVLHGDRATARRSGVDRRGRPEGQIVDVLERANHTVVGRFYDERGITFVVAENRRINQDLLVPHDERGDAKSGDVVVVEIVEQPSPQREAIARVVEVLGGYTDPGMEIEIALRKHDLPHEFSLAARKQAGKLPTEVTDRDRAGRVDLTRAAARHDRRRNGEGLRRRRLLRAQGQGLPPRSSRSPTSRTTCRTATRSTATRASAARRSISRAA